MPIRKTTDPGINSMSGLHLYQFFMSNCAQRVCLTLEEKGLDWTPHSINLFRGENNREEYYRINPRGLVPALVHDGVVITESIDILRYLDEHFPEPSLYPADPEQRRQVDEWMDLATENHVGVIKTYMYSSTGVSKKSEAMDQYRDEQEDPQLVEFHAEAVGGFSESRVLAAERELFAFFDRLERELGQHRWLVGDEFSYADIAWFVQYFLMLRLGLVNFENYPNIRRWGASVMRRPSFESGIRAMQPWYAPLMHRALRFKSRCRRGGPPPLQPRAPVMGTSMLSG